MTLIVSVYLPTNYGTPSNDDFLTALAELEGFIKMQSFHNIIIAGDFNTDFDRSSFRSTLLTIPL